MEGTTALLFTLPTARKHKHTHTHTHNTHTHTHTQTHTHTLLLIEMGPSKKKKTTCNVPKKNETTCNKLKTKLNELKMVPCVGSTLASGAFKDLRLMGGSVGDPGRYCYQPCRLLCSSILAVSNMMHIYISITWMFEKHLLSSDTHATQDSLNNDM